MFFQQKRINVFAIFQDRNFNIMLANNLLSFDSWTQVNIFFIIMFPQKMLLWYSLEAPHWGISHEYPQHVCMEK